MPTPGSTYHTGDANAGIQITFLSLHPEAVPRELQDAVKIAGFVSQISPFENASHHEYACDVLDMDRMFTRILLQLKGSSSVRDTLQSSSRILSLAIPSSPGHAPITFKCTLASQIMQQDSQLKAAPFDIPGRATQKGGKSSQALHKQPLFRIGNQTFALEPSAAGKLQQHIETVHEGKVDIQVQRIVQA
eukprot:CAMPEP_0202362736 /NCGR_PEP_ID=MMETSP1126-20121109/14807_1 /ASSEMBLY_ACC=CAM_ASM_000457 /TAXON_ID=3047 /ORGANISM="Dunaliella tertiolecta, Strain CCMP1320" /LENGTH=189 /DNA_ID=CAMNT_0048957003 /DNA_START=140 /DNA_END=707 /DNA_ORIENTATION=+